MSHEYVNLVTFEFLGHEPTPHELFGKKCKKCGGVPSSLPGAVGTHPCGDPLGITVKTVPSLRNGKHAYDRVWNGTVIGYKYRD